MLKEILFTHTDLDGAGCAILYELAHRVAFNDDEYKIIFSSNGSIDKNVTDWLDDTSVDINTKFTFADICCSRALLEEIIYKGYVVNIFDHHKTNAWALEFADEEENIRNEKANIIRIDTTGVESGTSVMFVYYYDLASTYTSEIPAARYIDSDYAERTMLKNFVNDIRLYDTFQWKDMNYRPSLYLNTLFVLLGMDRFVDKYVTMLTRKGEFGSDMIKSIKSILSDRTNRDALISEDEMVFVQARLDQEQNVIKNIIDNNLVHPIVVNGYNVALLLRQPECNHSDLAHSFLDVHTEYDYMAIFNLNSNSFSFRTNRDDIDLELEIAKPIGGGGHPKAAGAAVPPELMHNIVSEILRFLDKDLELILHD